MILPFRSFCEKLSIDQEALCNSIFYSYYLVRIAHSVSNQNLIYEAHDKCLWSQIESQTFKVKELFVKT